MKDMKLMKYILPLCLCLYLCLPLTISGQRFNSGGIGIELSSTGKISVFSPRTEKQKQVYRISLLAAADKNHAFTYIEDQDSIISSRNISSPKESDFEIYGAINNSFSNNPPDFTARFNIYGWNGEAYAVVKASVLNTDTLLKDIDSFIGFEYLPQPDSAFQFTTIKYNPEEKVITSFRAPSSTYAGIKLISDEIYSLRIIDWNDYYERGSGSDSLVYSLMSTKSIDTLLTGREFGASCLFSRNRIHLKLYDSTTVYLAVALGSNETEILNNINSAETRFLKPLSVDRKSGPRIPAFNLDQNYPNPFNPSTVISFSLPQKDFITLKVYDILGREVSALISSELEKGEYKINFSSQGLPSGTYFYRLKSGASIQTRKMIVTK